MKRITTITLLLVLLAILSAFYRILPLRPFNFTPVIGMMLTGAAFFPRRWMSYIIPLGALLVSDAIIGFHNQMWLVYGTYVLIISLGFLIRDKISAVKVLGLSLSSSLIFYLVTNFFCWYQSSIYTQDLAGLIINYTAALPYFRNSLLGDLLFSFAFIYGFQYVIQQFWNGVAFGAK